MCALFAIPWPLSDSWNVLANLSLLVWFVANLFWLGPNFVVSKLGTLKAQPFLLLIVTNFIS